MQKFLSTLLGLFFAFFSFGQIQPPNLSCVTTLFDGNVELQWTLPPPNPCGAFQGYRIYASQNPSAPFTLLATVTNPNQTTYTHVNANGNVNTWYYYMTTDLACPNQTVIPSSTLDNIDPETPQILSVSINNAGNVVVNWAVSPSLETAAYIIYQETNSGFIPIDTVFGRTNTIYEHFGVNINAPQTYTIAAMDACGNTGLLYDVPHQTILLRASVNRCEQRIELDWDPYENWDNPVAAYQIRTSVNGATRSLAATVPGSRTTHNIETIQDGDDICITVQAVELLTGNASSTNTVCLSVDIVQPMDYLYLSNLSLTDANQLEISWNWDINTDLETYALQQVRPDTTVLATFSPNLPLQPLNFMLDSTALVDSMPISFQITATDSCGLTVSSTTGATIFLTGIAEENYTNRLVWSPFELEFATVNAYLIYQLIDGEKVLIGTTTPNQLTFTDEVNGYNPNEANIQYFVVAQAYIELPDGTSKQILSQSNTTSVRQLTQIFMPNAFFPEGLNSEFRPVTVFAENSQFQMVIFSRWGEKVFETTNISEGWNGRKEGKIMRQGVYSYKVRVTQPTGEVIERQGTVLLLR